LKKSNFTRLTLLILFFAITTNFLTNKPIFQMETQAYIQKNPIESQLQWNRTYRGTNDDYSESLIQTKDGGFALVGLTNQSSSFTSNIWLIKTDSKGIVKWDQTYGGNKSDRASSLIQTTDNGYALVGRSGSAGGIWLIKTDENGIMKWTQTYWNSYPAQLLQTSDGGYAIVGSTYQTDMLLIKTDRNGVEQWNKTYGGSQDDYSNSFTITEDKGFALAGGTQSYGDASMDMWLVKTDSSGIVQWNQTYGGKGYDRAYSVIQTLDGGYALAGETTSFGVGERNMYVVKTDGNGVLQWNKTYGGETRDEALSLIQTSDSGFAIAGYTTSYGAGEADIWLVKTDANGLPQWNQTFGGPAGDYASTLIQTSDFGFAIAGSTRTFGDLDMWLVKTHGTGENPSLSPGFTFITILLGILSFMTLFKKKRRGKDKVFRVFQ
jgi:hypothetical protein